MTYAFERKVSGVKGPSLELKFRRIRKLIWMFISVLESKFLERMLRCFTTIKTLYFPAKHQVSLHYYQALSIYVFETFSFKMTGIQEN